MAFMGEPNFLLSQAFTEGASEDETSLHGTADAKENTQENLETCDAELGDVPTDAPASAATGLGIDDLAGMKAPSSFRSPNRFMGSSGTSVFSQAAGSHTAPHSASLSASVATPATVISPLVQISPAKRVRVAPGSGAHDSGAGAGAGAPELAAPNFYASQMFLGTCDDGEEDADGEEEEEGAGVGDSASNSGSDSDSDSGKSQRSQVAREHETATAAAEATIAADSEEEDGEEEEEEEEEEIVVKFTAPSPPSASVSQQTPLSVRAAPVQVQMQVHAGAGAAAKMRHAESPVAPSPSSGAFLFDTGRAVEMGSSSYASGSAGLGALSTLPMCSEAEAEAEVDGAEASVANTAPACISTSTSTSTTAVAPAKGSHQALPTPPAKDDDDGDGWIETAARPASVAVAVAVGGGGRGAADKDPVGAWGSGRGVKGSVPVVPPAHEQEEKEKEKEKEMEKEKERDEDEEDEEEEEEEEGEGDEGTESQAEELAFLQDSLEEDVQTLLAANQGRGATSTSGASRAVLQERIAVTRVQLIELKNKIARENGQTVSTDSSAGLASSEIAALAAASSSQQGAVRSLLRMHYAGGEKETGTGVEAGGRDSSKKNKREPASGSDSESEAVWDDQEDAFAPKGATRIFQTRPNKSLKSSPGAAAGAKRGSGGGAGGSAAGSPRSGEVSSSTKKRAAGHAAGGGAGSGSVSSTSHGTTKKNSVVLNVSGSSSSSDDDRKREEKRRRRDSSGKKKQERTKQSSSSSTSTSSSTLSVPASAREPAPMLNAPLGSHEDILFRVHDVPPSLSRLRFQQVQALPAKTLWDELNGMGDGAAGWHYTKAIGELGDWWYVRPGREHVRGGKRFLRAGEDYCTSYEECRDHVLSSLLLVKGPEALPPPSSTKKPRQSSAEKALRGSSSGSSSGSGMAKGPVFASKSPQAVFRSRSSSRDVRRPRRLDGADYVATFETQQLQYDVDSCEESGAEEDEGEGEGEGEVAEEEEEEEETGGHSPEHRSHKVGYSTSAASPLNSHTASPQKRAHRGYDRTGWNQATQQQEAGDGISGEEEEESAEEVEESATTQAQHTSPQGRKQSRRSERDEAYTYTALKDEPATTSTSAHKLRRLESYHAADYLPEPSVSTTPSTSATSARKAASKGAKNKARADQHAGGEDDVAESFLFAGMVFYFTGFTHQEQAALSACLAKHRGKVDASPAGLKDRLLAALNPDEAVVGPSQMYDDPEEVVLLSTPKVYRREKFLLALASLGGRISPVVPTHARWVWDSVRERRKLDLARYALPLGASQLRPFARTLAASPLPTALVHATPLPWDTVDRSSVPADTTRAVLPFSSPYLNPVMKHVSSLPRGQGILFGLTFLLLAIPTANFDWKAVLLAAGAAMVVTDPSEQLLLNLATGNTHVDISKELGEGQAAHGAASVDATVVGLVDPLAFGTYLRGMIAETSKESRRKSSSEFVKVPALDAVASWVSIHSQPSTEHASQARDPTVCIRILSLEWVVQCLTCGVRLHFDDAGYESAKTESSPAEMAGTTMSKSIRPLNAGTFRLPLASEVAHLQVYKSLVSNAERYMVNDVVIMNVATAASGNDADASHKRKAHSKSNKTSTTGTAIAGSKMGKIESFVTTDTNKTAVRVRLLHMLPATADAPARVQLSSTKSLLVAVDKLQEKALVLRRADYDLLEYISVPRDALGMEQTAPEAAGGVEIAGIYCASEEWEQAEERGDVQFAKRYYPHLFQERLEQGRKEEEDEDEEEEDDEEWQALPMSQDY